MGSAPVSSKTFSTLLCRKGVSSRAPSITLSFFSDNKRYCDEKRIAMGSSRQQLRFYSPMSEEEEEAEKLRMADLSPFKKDQELRQLNREIMKLNMLKGINTGELYTMRGRYKLLLQEYGMPMIAWYSVIWLSSAVGVFTLAEVGGMDAMAILAYADSFTGLDMCGRVDPTMGKVGVVLILNEMLEPLRLPFVVLTVKPVIDRIFPPKV